MTLSEMIQKLRTSRNLSQSQFAELFHVSQQAVQKWESGATVPDLEKIVRIAKYFDISVDTLVLGSDNRTAETMRYSKILKPRYSSISSWDAYSSDLMTEYQQAVEEGRDMEAYRDLFTAVSKLPGDEIRKDLGDILFRIVLNAPQREGYPYVEPSDLKQIQTLRRPWQLPGAVPEKQVLRQKIHGAWAGRICGCLLGKTVEGITREELQRFLKETGNSPMHRYILSGDITPELCSRYNFRFEGSAYADEQPYMPFDDDTNYTVMAQEIVEKYGRDFTPCDVSRSWLREMPKEVYCTAEQVAYRNFVAGYEPPESAAYKNPYREWIGAQIRGDYFGYINPGDPEKAAEMAFRDACISHVKNGIYGEMFAAAMLACAAVTDDCAAIIEGGLAQIPQTSRLFEHVTAVLTDWRNGVSAEEAFRRIHEKFNERTSHGWCHTISNAMIVAASLLYGQGDYGKSICMAVEAAFDTDCNGATVGSVLGMALGYDRLGSAWTDPICDTLETTLFGMNKVSISDRVELTMKHIGL